MRDNPRTRPAKAPLGRAAVVAAALALVDEVGFAAVTMRRVAQALDTGPASLYVYVADRNELMAQVYDLALAEVELPGPADGDWRERLELLVSRMIRVLSRHDDLALVALTGVQTGPHSLRVMEETLRLLREGGVDDATCAWAADLLDQHVIASALERAGWLRDQRRAADAGAQDLARAAGTQLDEVIGALPAEDYPTLHALRRSMTSTGNGDARAAWQLSAIIDGLLARRR
ncbi:TetR family transcriptional regulator [Actinoplanes ianthinogenes]|uniref:TetR family transcriptional regulator n=1 Tax=Actinoplanes ianthinogenes TaxID=122358 RepID=A0ABN6CRV5_9ACTN|nr:TetR/AcrR family transcriptional regulator C-terminal domain-containing protein [Actinoplanes ianthinogenes]BCJ47968.1 TetR family transcriptional regulator [Actinoplanes ianthinogenes]GGR05433.1 TetR family transcriptional regulator [Actinoplanes ianthinogenes]